VSGGAEYSDSFMNTSIRNRTLTAKCYQPPI
jgi:hypothetical protein